MAKDYPHVEVTGIDLVQVPIEPDQLPPNCHFEIDDIRLGLTHFQGKYDFVHARVIASWMEDRDKAMNDIHMCLKPGGIMIWMDGDYDFYTPDPHVYQPIASSTNPTGSWFTRIYYGTYRLLGISILWACESSNACLLLILRRN
jgi:SAM-dependent methyltransferase